MVSTHSAEEDPRNNDILVYVNGELFPRHEAKISVYDSGFLLGDGIWEGIRLHNCQWIFLSEHLDRLFEAANAIGIDPGMSRQEILLALEKT